MAPDAATMALCAAELNAALPEARIDKIFQPAKDEILLNLRTRAASFRLLIAARTGYARVCLTDETYENPATPPSFCMLLRKHLTGGRLLRVRGSRDERIMFFDFMCTNEMGDLVYNTLAAELMGRYCNVVLFRRELPEGVAAKNGPVPGNTEFFDGKILDALKRVDFDDSGVRQLLPGLPYTLPPRRDVPDFFSMTEESLAAAFGGEPNAQQEMIPAETALKKLCGGVGPAVVREVLFRAGVDGARPLPASATGPGEGNPAVGRLWQAIREIQTDYANGGVPTMVRKPDGEAVEFSFTALTQYAPPCEMVRYGGYSQLLEAFYAGKNKAERMRQKSKALRKTVQNLCERAVRKQAARMEEQAEGEKSDSLRVFGELLTANLHTFQKGDKSVTVQNWYTGSDITIPLDVRLAPSANAQKYFKEYRKKQTAAKMLEKLLAESAHETAYLKSVLYEVDAAENEAELNEVRAELKSAGYLKYYKQRDKKQKPADFWRYTSSDGFLILAGRNNVQNEKLSLKTARGKDLWFHVKNAPGSHVVVMSGGKDIPLPTQNEAAMLAVWHSGQQNSAQVPVDYTEVKNLRKTGDLPPGMVLYEHYETAYVTPEADVLEQLGATGGAAAAEAKGATKGTAKEAAKGSVHG